MIDSISIERLNRLHPRLRDEALTLYSLACQRLTGRASVRVVQGYRTFSEQATIYGQGRSRPGAVISNAKPGSSFHNYGLAFDFCLLIDGKEVSWDIAKDWDADGVLDWREVVDVFEAAGWAWGGRWKSIKDYPHLEKSFGKTWRELLALHQSGSIDGSGYVIF